MTGPCATQQGIVRALLRPAPLITGGQAVQHRLHLALLIVHADALPR
jgi:hypothetical protein